MASNFTKSAMWPTPDMCLAQEWQRDGRGVWAMRACQYYTGHGSAHAFGSWRYNVQPLAEAEPVAPPDGATLIAAERRRQIDAEGWTPAHDDAHGEAELVGAALCYASYAGQQARGQVVAAGDRLTYWPWEPAWWTPSDQPIRNLTKAGALIAAEIDRLQRRAALPDPGRRPQRQENEKHESRSPDGDGLGRTGRTSTVDSAHSGELPIPSDPAKSSGCHNGRESGEEHPKAGAGSEPADSHHPPNDRADPGRRQEPTP